MWLELERTKKPSVKDPVLVVAVSTSMAQYKAMYSQGRELGSYMLRRMKLERIAVVHSSAFPPEVIIREGGVASLPECCLYEGRGGRDVLLFTGDASPMDGQYEFAESLLDYAEGLGVRELYSVGARWTENPLPPEADPEPNGFATDGTGVARLKQHKVKVLGEEPAPFFASMVVGMASAHGMRGYKLSVDHGEPVPHSRSVARLLQLISAMAGLRIPLEAVRQERPRAKEGREGDPSIYR